MSGAEQSRYRVGPGYLDDAEISPLRRGFDELFLSGLQRLGAFVAAHWLALLNLWMAAFSIFPLLAPVLLAQGLAQPASLLYSAYGHVCHQAPERSFFILGQKVAYCQRDTAVYLSVLAAGLAYSFVRHRVRSLDWRLYCLLVCPMAVDGLTQLLGWRESTWELRSLTGVLFGVASVWLGYPLFEKSMAQLAEEMSPPPSLPPEPNSG